MAETSQIQEASNPFYDKKLAENIRHLAIKLLKNSENKKVEKIHKITPAIKISIKNAEKNYKTSNSQGHISQFKTGNLPKNIRIIPSISKSYRTSGQNANQLPKTIKSTAGQLKQGHTKNFAERYSNFSEQKPRRRSSKSRLSRTWSRVKEHQKRGNIKIRKNWKSFKSSKEKWATPERRKSASLISGMSVNFMKDSISSALQLDQTMQDLKRTVRFSEPEQFAQMRQSILDLSNQVPVTTNAIAGMVKAASQSGIAKDQLMNFATTASKVSVAFGMSEDQTTSALLKWRKDLGITGQQTNAFADTIAHMSQTMNVSSASIMELIDTKGALAKKAGLTNQEIAGLATAMLASGTSTDTAAAGLEKLVTTLSNAGELNPEQAEQFRKLGIDPTEIAAGMDTDAGATIDGLLKKLRQIEKSKRGAALTNLFGADAAQAILPLVNNTDRLTNAFKASHSQAEAQNALQRDFAEGATSASQSAVLLENRISNLKATLGTALLPALVQISETLGTVIVGIATFSSEYPALTQYVIGGIGALWATVKVAGILSSGFGLLTGILPILGAGLSFITALIIANPIGAIIAVVVAGVTLLANAMGWLDGIKSWLGIGDDGEEEDEAKKLLKNKPQTSLSPPDAGTPPLPKKSNVELPKSLSQTIDPSVTKQIKAAEYQAANQNQGSPLQLAAVPAQQGAAASSVQNNTFNNTFQIGDHRSGDVERLAREVAKVLKSQRNGSLRG